MPIKGESNIYGYFNAEEYPHSEGSPLPLITTSLTSTTNIVWGDWQDNCDDYVYVKVIFDIFDKRADGTKVTPARADKAFIVHKFHVSILCVVNPDIVGKDSIQLCCKDTVEFCDDSWGKQDEWLWKIRGEGADTTVLGTGDKGQGKKCIKVAVNNTGEFVVSAKAWRKTGHEDHIREDSVRITRYQPRTSAITFSSNAYGGEFGSQLWACTGEEIEICVDAVCGMTGVIWDFGRAFDVISGAGTRCVTIKPRSTYAPDDNNAGGEVIPEGAIITLSAQVSMSGGCSTTISTANIPIFTGGTPPMPDGNVYAETDPADPCGPYANQMEIEYIDPTPYVGGYTVWSPQSAWYNINSNNIVDVTVCNINTCSGLMTCRVYSVSLPEPCQNPFPFWSIDDGDIDDTNPTYKSNRNRRELEVQNQLKIQEVVVYPNIATDIINIRTSKLMTAKVVLLDARGNSVIETKLENTNKLVLSIPSNLSNGVYYLSMQNDKKIILKKIIIQK